jgi:hypothetical protein
MVARSVNEKLDSKINVYASDYASFVAHESGKENANAPARRGIPLRKSH